MINDPLSNKTPNIFDQRIAELSSGIYHFIKIFSKRGTNMFWKGKKPDLFLLRIVTKNDQKN